MPDKLIVFIITMTVTITVLILGWIERMTHDPFGRIILSIIFGLIVCRFVRPKEYQKLKNFIFQNKVKAILFCGFLVLLSLIFYN